MKKEWNPATYDYQGNLVPPSDSTDGTIVSVDWSNPTGPFANLAVYADWSALGINSDRSPVPLYFEGVHADPDEVITVTFSTATTSYSQSIHMNIVDIGYQDMSGNALDGAPSLPEEQLIAAGSDTSDSAIGQGLTSQFNKNKAGAEFKTILSGLVSASGDSLLEGGQSIAISGDTTVSPELMDAGGNLSVDGALALEGTYGLSVLPMNATFDLKTAYDDLPTILLTEQPTQSLSPDVGGGGGGPPVVAADFFFDGTGNDAGVDAQGPNPTDTNVWKMHVADPNPMNTYLYGVGTKAANGHFSVLGGITGLDADEIIGKAWDALLTDISQGANTIDIVGFSRGASEALEFLNRIAAALKQHSILLVDPAGRGITKNGLPVWVDTTMLQVRFVGLYDTITTYVGVNGYVEDKRITIPTGITITQVVHAIAMSEHRAQFPLTLLTQGGATNFLQEGFIGAHADIGGGYLGMDGISGHDGLSNIPLHWMMYEASLLPNGGWTFNTTYPNLVNNYDETQVHYSQADSWVWSLNLPVNRSFPTTLLCWTPGPTPAGTLIQFGSKPLVFWDPFWYFAAQALRQLGA